MRIQAITSCLWALVLLCAAPVAAQEKRAVAPGFELKPGAARIVLMRPTVHVGAQSTGGMYEPNADWTTESRENIERALKAKQGTLGNVVIAYDEGTSGEAVVVSQYASLFGTVADSVIEYQFFPGNRLPTKKRKGTFDWGVGDGVARLKSLKNADYALFINTLDAYGSTGRKMLQIVGMFAGVGLTSGQHWGHAGLVDLKTGQLVWLNADRQMGGDVRTPEGAAKRVEQLLRGFPGRPEQAAPAAAQPASASATK